MTVLPPRRRRRARQADTTQQAGLGPLNYDELPGLEDVYLEDTFVREIVETPDYLRFVLLAALTPAHGFFEPPPPGDRHCYRAATLTFPQPKQVTWHERSHRTYSDAQGAVDHGNIDRLVAMPAGFYHVEGEWGSVDVVSKAPVLEVVAAVTRARGERRRAWDAWVRGGPAPGDAAHRQEDDHDHDHSHE